MKTLKIILGAIIILSISSCQDCSDCEEGLQKANDQIENLKSDKETSTKQLFTYKNFEFVQKGYFSNKIYYRNIIMPVLIKDLDGNGKNDTISPDFAQLQYIQTINSFGRNIHILLEVLKHNKPYYESMIKEPLQRDTLRFINLNSIVNSKGKPEIKHHEDDYLWVVSLHDEHYPYQGNLSKYNDSIINAIKKVLVVNGCDMGNANSNCVGKIRKIVNEIKIPKSGVSFNETEPGTVGGGVIPPK